MLNAAKIYLLRGISKSMCDPKEILFDKAHKVKNRDIKANFFISLLVFIEKRFFL